jgi:hypothetical protein
MIIGILMVAFLPPLIIAVVLVLERIEESLGATSDELRTAPPYLEDARTTR